jgi:xanthosine utilization system XapX-like protein
MSAEESLRRQLRFAFFLQIAGAALFGIAFATRAVALGFDPVTALLGLVAILIVVAAVVTRRKMQDLAR